MIFSSLTFLFFFLTVTVSVYFLLPRKLKNLWLFLTSLFFYGYGEPVYVLLMLASITVNYVLGILIERVNRKKTFLILAVAVNLLILGYFKYLGLFTSTVALIFKSVKVRNVALPIGISFYTFQTVSYLIDVYRGDCTAQKNYVKFGTYVSMFPQLIAGPIVRYKDIEAQLNGRRESFEAFSRGVRLFTVGLAKKVLLANAFGEIYSEFAFGGTLVRWLSLFIFSLQLYFDFSGYSDMARGLGGIFGFEFVKNFDYPYISRSVTEFWRRWHISLGTWFREYVYIPFGGNRKGKMRQCINVVTVWALTGLWHGASWNFVLWGLYFGVILLFEKLFLLKLLKKAPGAISWLYTVILVMLSWILFNYTDLSAIGDFIKSMFTLSPVTELDLYTLISSLPIIIIGVIACTPFTKTVWTRLKYKKYFALFEASAVLIILVICTSSLVTGTYNPFLYFRF